MLRTPNIPDLQLEGIDQQDFSKLQLVKGAFPFQIGLQQRLPGKTLQQIVAGPVGSIYVFYSVFGRHYTLIDFGKLQIEEVAVPPITPPGLPPNGDEWIDTFSGYPDGLVQRLWGAGLWPSGVGICQSIIDGIFDPFLVYSEINAPASLSPSVEQQPQALPTPDVDPDIPIGTPTNNPPPDRGFTTRPFSDAFTDFHTIAPTVVDGGEDGPPESRSDWEARGWTPQYLNPVVYDSSSAGGTLSAHVEHLAFVGYNNLAFAVYGYSRRVIAFTYKSTAMMDLSAADIPARSEVYLIGTKTISDGAGGTTSEEVWEELTAFVNAGPRLFHVLPPDGIDHVVSPAPGLGDSAKSKSGTLTWDEFRIYDAEPL